MIRSQAKAQPKTHQYQIKYRLTGVVIIVGFAIVVISALLNEPSIESSTRLTNNAGSRQTFTLEIPVPNSGNNFANQNSSPSEDSAGGYDDNETKPALLRHDSVVTATQIPITLKTKGEDEDESEDESKDAGENIVLSKDKSKTKKPDSESNSESNSVSSQSKATTKSTQTQPDESSKDIAKNGSGWTVRVGTYSKIENVDSVSALLNSHGFDARHAKVKTSLGVATRIWLGPYTQKKTAEKVSIQMKLIIGEKGYVTKTSS